MPKFFKGNNKVKKLNKVLFGEISGGCRCFKRPRYRVVEDYDYDCDYEDEDYAYGNNANNRPANFVISSVNKYFLTSTVGRNVDFAEGRRGRMHTKDGDVY